MHCDISLVILFVQSLGSFWQNWATLVWTVHFSNDNEANVIFGSVLKTCSAFKRDRNCD